MKERHPFFLDLRLDAVATAGTGEPGPLSPESQQLRDRLYGQMGLKPHSGRAWVTLDLDATKGWRAFDDLLAICRSDIARVGSAHLRAKPDDDGDWYLVQTKTAYDSFSLWDVYPSFKPGTHPPGHALNHTFVSRRFVDAVVSAGLNGISFLQCRNAGRKKVQAWFVALPDLSLGRGLDHQWFDRARWLRDVEDDPGKRLTSLHEGQSQFHQCWLRDDAIAQDELVKRLLELAPMPAVRDPIGGLQFVTAPRYWTKAFPAADFAYVPWGEDGPNREGKMMRFRKLAVSRGARAALLDAGLFKDTDFLAFRSVVTPEPGVVVLDEGRGPIPPMYSVEELAILRSEEKRQFAKSKREAK